jgi:Trm5-related predicted tRNA methylase
MCLDTSIVAIVLATSFFTILSKLEDLRRNKIVFCTKYLYVRINEPLNPYILIECMIMERHFFTNKQKTTPWVSLKGLDS